MAGVKGRSGGRNKQPAHVHQLRGTYRPDRQGVASAAAIAPAAYGSAVPPPEVLTGLGDDGRQFIEATYREYEFALCEGLVLRLAGQALDDAAAARRRGDERAARQAGRQVLAVLQRLNLP